MDAVLAGLLQLSQPHLLLIIFCGFTLGFAVGAVPGFNDANLMAILLPLSVYMDPIEAVVGMSVLYFSAQTAGSVPAILMNIPGTGGNAATTLDGHPMARMGQGGRALGLSLGASTVGATFGAVAALILAPALGRAALSFGPAELFLVAVFGLTIVGSVSGSDPLRAIFAICLGILVAMIGVHPASGFERSTWGLAELYDGIGLIPVILGLFGVPELIALCRQKTIETGDAPGEAPDSVQIWQGFREALRYRTALAVSSVTGLIVGIVPGAGAAIGSFVSYGFVRRLSKRPQDFGKGSPEGLIGSDAANNAVACGAVIPLITLGLPGSASTTVMLAALALQGIRPGPQFFMAYETQAFTILWSFMAAALLIAVVGIPFARLSRRITRVPMMRLAPVTLFLLCVGAYANRFSVFDMGLMLGFGAIGIAMRAGRYPIPAFLLAFILTPVLEANYQRATRIGGHDIFLQSPICLGLIALSVASLLIPLAGRLWIARPSSKPVTHES